ncbi:transcription factor WhiB [Streptomyces lunaelactis]|nr:transcription factor WhiB [Streptomyces lunaelactis]NUK74667.1 transcription factor WhiB [Streptomyces lunaelactis]NUL13218.1 transcription factor WhiB [Streptomyces lunaelactis]NUL26232.1 transcription factor WhiB [Streptomyces lunaelactis]
MTSDQARQSRRAVLQAAVDAGAACARPDAPEPDAWFREDNEQQITWQARRTALIRFCKGCPLMAACQELALRNGDGNDRVDDLVRGGKSGQELAANRERQAVRIEAAITTDRAGDQEWNQLVTLSVRLQREAVKNPDKGGGGLRRQGAAQAAQNTQVRELTAQVNEIRTARRARTGWGEAA